MLADVIGIPDPWIWTAYLLCLVAAVLCVVYAAWRSRDLQTDRAPANEAETAQPAEISSST
jgi:hypothetical protein